jgi:hypothetical protein
MPFARGPSNGRLQMPFIRASNDAKLLARSIWLVGGGMWGQPAWESGGRGHRLALFPPVGLMTRRRLGSV